MSAREVHLTMHVEGQCMSCFLLDVIVRQKSGKLEVLFSVAISEDVAMLVCLSRKRKEKKEVQGF